jgi:hypothetical protein
MPARPTTASKPILDNSSEKTQNMLGASRCSRRDRPTIVLFVVLIGKAIDCTDVIPDILACSY